MSKRGGWLFAKHPPGDLIWRKIIWGLRGKRWEGEGVDVRKGEAQWGVKFVEGSGNVEFKGNGPRPTEI